MKLFSKKSKPKSFYATLPAQEDLRSASVAKKVEKVNAHFHTPFSFSSFSSLSQVFEMADNEKINILGINDFYVTDGYDDFAALAVSNKVFPLFNIEFIALNKAFQEKGIRVNDPNNPGRTYFSGKGLSYPTSLPKSQQKKMEVLIAESQRQASQMVEKLNAHLAAKDIALTFTLEDIRRQYAKNLVRERHLAKALRIGVQNMYPNENEQIKTFELIFDGKSPKSGMNDAAGLENEIRGNLLKTGGAAFVPEDDKAFLSLEEVIQIILDAGGIPCYPVLLDDAKGAFTDFEGDWPAMAEFLESRNIRCIELIPGRNSLTILREFVQFFDSRNFVVLLGTEHNTPDLQPLTVSCRNNEPLDDYLLEVSYRGACVVAAHQYLTACGKNGFVYPCGHMAADKLGELQTLGHALIQHFIG